MLTDQEFFPPITIGLGHEMFFAPDYPQGVYFPNVSAFKKVHNIGNFVVFLVTTKVPLGVPDIENFYRMLIALGVNFSDYYLFDPLIPDEKKKMGELIATLDIVYAPSLFQAGATPQMGAVVDLPSAGLLDCLQDIATIPEPFNQGMFHQKVNRWKKTH